MSNIIETTNKQTSSQTMRNREPRTSRSGRKKERSTSSLAGMFDTTVVDVKHIQQQQQQPPSLFSAASSSDAALSAVDASSKKYSDAEKQQLAAMTRKLSQIKRRLFLQSVGALPPAPSSDSSVERLREILLRISFDNEQILEAVPEDEMAQESTSASSLLLLHDETIQV
jgi:hypothetical protein